MTEAIKKIRKTISQLEKDAANLVAAAEAESTADVRDVMALEYVKDVLDSTKLKVDYTKAVLALKPNTVTAKNLKVMLDESAGQDEN